MVGKTHATNCESARRHMTDDTSCLIFGGTQETIQHVLCDFCFATNVWMKMLYSDCVRTFFELELDEWLNNNLKGTFRMGTSIEEFKTIFTVLCWMLLKNKNVYVL